MYTWAKERYFITYSNESMPSSQMKSENTLLSDDDEEPFCITVQNTSGKTLCQWHLSKSADMTPINLLIFLRDELGIPFDCLILYIGNKSLTYRIGVQDRRWHDKELLIRDCDGKVQVALRNYCNNYDQTVIDGFAEKFDLKQARCVQIIDEGCRVPIIDNVLDRTSELIYGQKNWLRATKDMIYKDYGIFSSVYTLSLVNDILNLIRLKDGPLKKPLNGSECIEDLFISSNTKMFEEIVHLEISLDWNLDEERRQDYYFSLLKVETLVLKSLTTVKELEICGHRSLQSLREFVDSKWKIPRHLQVYMHHGREIDDNQLFVDLFLEHASFEERLNGSLMLNLISKEPNTISIGLVNPYSSLHNEKLGLPQYVEIKETATLIDVEKAILETTEKRFSIYPPIETYFHRVRVEEKTCLYELDRKVIEAPLHLRIYRCVNVQLQHCDQCEFPEPLQKKLDITSSDVFIKDIEMKINDDFPNGFCCQQTKLKLLTEPGDLLSLRTHALDVEDFQVLNFKAMKSLSTRFKQFFKLKK